MAERETLPCDILIVGAGPAGLSCAIHLADELKKKPLATTPSIYVIEKGPAVGAHILSGAVLDPRTLNELIPDWKNLGAPVKTAVSEEEIVFLTQSGSIRVPGFAVPPYLHNKGNYVVSLGELTIWLAEQAKARGGEILEGLAGAELVLEGSRVAGVRCGDTGIGKDGQPRSNFTPGAEIRAQVTILAEGVRGSLTKQLTKALKLKGTFEQTYATGVKELWEVPAGRRKPGWILHSLGFPLQRMTPGGEYKFGGSFVYALDETHLAAGLVVGLDYQTPGTDPHALFSQWKTHPYMRELLKDGKPVCYGAKAIPEGGYYSMPRNSGDGYVIVGDSGSFLNAARLKGIHLAMKSGMLAAETAYAALEKNDSSAAVLGTFSERFKQSWAHEELWRVRNWRAGYARGLIWGSIHDFAQRLSGGRGLRDPLLLHADHEMMARKAANTPDATVSKPDGVLTYDKVTDVFFSGTNHAEDQPAHLKVPDSKLCVERCTKEFGNPCQNFCPAGVYEWVKEGQGRLQINFGNCVHCKTCDIKDPYENILWTTPEGGGGPRYQRM